MTSKHAPAAPTGDGDTYLTANKRRSGVGHEMAPIDHRESGEEGK